MKIKSLLIAFTLIWSQISIAQITEGGKSMSQGYENSLTLEMPNIDAGFGDKLWKKYIKGFGGKTKKSKSEWFTDDTQISGIGGANTIDIFMQSNESGEDLELAVWFDLGGAYLNSSEHPDAYLEAEKFLMRFALFVAREKTNVELDTENKAMSKLESLLKRLERDNERYHREIELAKEKIRQNESNIETNIVEQEETRKLIELQIQQLEKIKQRLAELN